VGPGTTITLDPGCKIRLQSHILTADTLEEEVIETTHFSWTWNATQIFPDLEPQQFSKAMQSLNDYGLHIVDAADIAHHLKFENFNDPIPTSITDLFTNPMHSISLVFFAIAILFLCYKLYKLYRKKIHEKLNPSHFNCSAHSFSPVSSPTICAQSANEHGNDQHSAAVKSSAKQTPKEGEKYQLRLSAELGNPAPQAQPAP
jgi:hypothetical protein